MVMIMGGRVNEIMEINRNEKKLKYLLRQPCIAQKEVENEHK